MKRKNTRRNWFLLLTLSLLNTAGFCQTDKSAKTLLWEVKGKNLSSPSYLYGTMHTTDKRAFKFIPSVSSTFDQCKAFAMEVDPEDADPKVMMEAIKMDSTQLSDLLSNEEYTELKQLFKDELHMDLELFKTMKPFFVMSMIMQAKYGKQMAQAVDLHFHKMAKDQQKQTYGLESIEEQLGAIDRVSLEEQAQMLLESLKSGGGKKDPSEKLIKYYAKGDLQKMAEMAEDSEYSEDFSQGLVVERNHKMVERMIPLMEQRPTFVAVGALHLPGEEGILTLLEKEGYTVSPILK